MPREDGRQPAQLRGITSEQGVLNRADGSARLSQGQLLFYLIPLAACNDSDWLRIAQSSVLVAVYGPSEAKQIRKEHLDRAHIDVVFKPMSGQPGLFVKHFQ